MSTLDAQRSERALELAQERGWLDPARVDALRRLNNAWGKDPIEGALEASWLTPAQAGELRAEAGAGGLPPAEPTLEIGQRVGDYVLEARLGAGAMGTVYAARHVHADVRHAVKLAPFLHPDPEREEVKRFLREGRSMARVQHPGVVRVHTCDLLPTGWGLLAMDLVEGESLEDWLQAGPLPIPAVLDLATQIAEALAAIHAVGIVHRDLKPANVLVRKATGRLVLCDFGVAHDLSATRLTQSGQMIGSPLYMAPEQICGERHLIGPASDVYAWGVSVYRMLAGHPPFDAGSLAELASRIVAGQPEPMRRADVPRSLRKLLAASMVRHPADRPSARELLTRLAEGDAGSNRGPLIAFVALAVVALLLAVGIGVVAASDSGPESEPAAPAEAHEEVAAPPPAAPASVEQVETAVQADDPARAKEILAALPTPPDEGPRLTALIAVLDGRPHDTQALLAGDRPWIVLEEERRAFQAELERVQVLEQVQQNLEAAERLALKLGRLGKHELLEDPLSQRMGATLIWTLLDLDSKAVSPEREATLSFLRDEARRLLPEGDLRAQAVWALSELGASKVTEGLLPDLDVSGWAALGPRWADLATAVQVLRTPLGEFSDGLLLEAFAGRRVEPRVNVELHILRRAHRKLAFHSFERLWTALEKEANPEQLRVLYACSKRTAQTSLSLSESGEWANALAHSERQVLARVLLIAKRHKRARKLLEPLRSKAEEAQTELLLAECALQRGSMDTAGKHVMRVDAHQDWGVEHRMILAMCLLEKGGLEEAKRALREAQGRNPGEAFLYWRSLGVTRQLLRGGPDVRRPLWRALGEE